MKNFLDAVKCFLLGLATGLVDIVDSDGGHLVILIGVIAAGLHWHIALLYDGMVVLLAAKLKEAGSNRNREAKYKDPTPPPTVTP